MLSTDKKVYQYNTPITITGNNGVGNNGVLFRNNIAIALGGVTIGNTIQNEFNTLSYPTDAPVSAYTLLEVTNSSTLDLTNSLTTFLADIETVLPQYDFSIVSNQLTTLEKVKASLGILPADTSKDVLINDFINQATSFIQNYCGRVFAMTTYTNELYDIPNGSKLFTHNYPVASVASVQYRTGTIGAPTYVSFTTNDYLVYLAEGYISFISQFGFGLGSFVTGEQALRMTYDAGYLIDWANEGDPTLHTLPADLTMVATQLVAGMFNTRATQGLKSESTEGQSVDYGSISDRAMTKQQVDVLGGYAYPRLTI